MPPNLSVKLLIVDDHPLFRQGVRSALSIYDDIEIVADTSSGEDAIAWLTSTISSFTERLGGMEAAPFLESQANAGRLRLDRSVEHIQRR